MLILVTVRTCFKDLQQDYAVKFSELKAIMAQNDRVLHMDEVPSHKFSIEGRSFVLFYSYDSNPREEPLIRLCPYSSILFSHNVKNPYVYKTTFTSACWTFEELSDEVQVSHGKEHEKCLKKYNFLKSCPFVIVDEKEWVPPRY